VQKRGAKSSGRRRAQWAAGDPEQRSGKGAKHSHARNSGKSLKEADQGSELHFRGQLADGGESKTD
jgi:hypothetical protein